MVLNQQRVGTKLEPVFVKNIPRFVFVNNNFHAASALHLLAAGDGTAAEVSTGFGVDHGGNVLFGHEVCEELLTALCLLPARCKQTECIKVSQK